MDITQVLLTLALTISTIFAVVIGIQLILVLKELRKTLKTVNTIVHSFEALGTGLEHNLFEVVGFFRGIKSVLKIFDGFGQKKNENS